MPAMSEHFTVVGRPHGLVERHSTALQPTSSAGVLPRPTPTPAAETTTAKPNRCQIDAEQLRALRDPRARRRDGADPPIPGPTVEGGAAVEYAA